MRKIISKLPKWFVVIQGIPYFCMFITMIEMILESNIFKIHIDTDIITKIWCLYCVHCVHIVGVISVATSILALVINFKSKSTRKRYIIYTLIHVLMAWFTWFWFNALMSV